MAGSAWVRSWRRIAFVASASAAGIHFAAVHGHIDEYAPAGAFMLIAGIAQFGWAVSVSMGAPRRVLAAGILGNAATVALWTASRTAGLPFGPEPGMPEHIHGADALATALEVLIIVAAFALIADVVPRPEPVLIRFAYAGALSTLVAVADDPARDALIAGATIVLAVTARAFLAVVGSVVPRPDGRSHVEISFARRRAGWRGAAAGAGVGARG